MGKVTADPSPQPSTTRFSHPHPLQPSTLPTPTATCAACKTPASGPVYTCTQCTFILHQKCFQLPKQITHEFHKSHTLHLLSKPVYPDGRFNCDACGHNGDGFSYHCSPCGIDLHSACASLPMQVTHHSHHHQLSLHFSSPYPNNSFSCDLCKGVSSNTWLYRCTTCEFDVHLSCVNSQSQRAQPAIISRSGPKPSPPPPAGYPPTNGAFGPGPQPPAGYPPTNGNYGPGPLPPAGYPPTNGGYGPGPLPPAGYPVTTGAYASPPAGFPMAAQNQFAAASPYPNPTQAQMQNYGQPAVYGAPMNNGMRDQMMVGVANGVASGVSQAAAQAMIQAMFGGGGGGGGGNVDVTGGGGGVMMMDGGGGYYDSGYGGGGGVDGGFGGGDVSSY